MCPHTNVKVSKFDRAVKKVKGHSRIIIWTNFVDLESLTLYTKIHPQSFLGSGEQDV